MNYLRIYGQSILKTVIISGLVLMSCTHEKPKIGFLLPNLDNERYPKDSANFASEIRKLGGEVFVTDARANDQLQIEQARELIEKGVKILVLAPANKNTAATIVRNAHEHHIPVISYERMVANCSPDFFISFDNVKVGEIMAAYAIKIKPQGKYYLLGGDKTDQNAVWVKEGQMKVISSAIKEGKIKIVYDSFIESWNGNYAYQEVKRYLDLSCNDVPDVILSAYDGLSTGAIAAFEENGISPEEFPVITGQNAEVLACRNIVKGKQRMTVYKPIRNLAIQAAKIAWKMVQEESIETTRKVSNGTADIPSLLIDPVCIDKTNLKDIITDGYLKESQIFAVNQ